MTEGKKEYGVYCYPDLPGISTTTGMAELLPEWEAFLEYARLKYEFGAEREAVQKVVDWVRKELKTASDQMQELKEDDSLKDAEPDGLEAIRSLRPEGTPMPRFLFREEEYRKKIRGAVYGRFSGCTLGAPVEFWSVEEMERWAKYCGQQFPPTEYWKKTKRPDELRYEVSRFQEYELSRITKVPVDDDVTYTILNWLVLKECGPEFTTGQLGEIWAQYLPRACTAEEIVLDHLKKGMSAERAADVENPYVQWIGAAIRADVWGYVCPGMPQKAAELAWRDAFLTHRRNGIYSEMYFAAVIARAFAAQEGTQSSEGLKGILMAGLDEIPQNCLLARDIRWALDKAAKIVDYREARKEAEAYFEGMSGVHANLNACLTIWGLLIGKENFTDVIGQVTAMGFDNDCNAATAGSIFGAYYGIDRIPKKWYEPFRNEVATYLNGYESLEIETLCEDFLHTAKKIRESDE